MANGKWQMAKNKGTTEAGDTEKKKCFTEGSTRIFADRKRTRASPASVIHA